MYQPTQPMKPKTFCTKSCYLYRSDRYYTPGESDKPVQRKIFVRPERPHVQQKLQKERSTMSTNSQCILTDAQLEQALLEAEHGLTQSIKLPDVPLYYTYDNTKKTRTRSLSSLDGKYKFLKEKYGNYGAPGPQTYNLQRSDSGKPISILSSRTNVDDVLQNYRSEILAEKHKKTNPFLKRFQEKERRNRQLSQLTHVRQLENEDLYDFVRDLM